MNTASIANTITINTSQLSGDILSDELSDEASSPDSSFDTSELMETTMSDEITTHLAAAGFFFFRPCQLLIRRQTDT